MVVSLQDAVRLYVDSTESLGIDDVLNKQALFEPMDSFVYYHSVKQAFWLHLGFRAVDSLKDWRLLLRWPDSKELDVLEVRYFAMNHYVDAYFVVGGSLVSKQRSGLFLPLKEKDVKEHPGLNIFSFDMAAGDSLDVYLRVDRRFGDNPIVLFPEIRSPKVAIPREDSMGLLVFFCFGFALVIGLLSLLFFVMGRDLSYLYFALFSFFLAFHFLLLDPNQWVIVHIIPNHPFATYPLFLILAYGFQFFFLLFGTSYINAKEKSKWLHYFFIVCMGATLFVMTESLIQVSQVGGTLTTRMHMMVLQLLMLAVGLWSIFLKDIFAKIFGFGTIWKTVFTILGVLWNMGVLKFEYLNPWAVGQLGLLVIYIVGLAYKFRQNEQFRRDADRIMELDKMKSRFFANISHEFRTPLTLILGPVKKLIESAPVSDLESQKEDVELTVSARNLGVVHRNALRLQELVNQLLDLSKIESGSMRLKATEAPLIPFLRALVFSFESLAERRHIHFQASFHASDTTFWFDRDKLEKITVNLLSNAFKYTPEQGHVSVWTRVEHGRLKFIVEDSGPGIPKEEMDRIFNRFYQMEGTEEKGSGIGLSLVKELVDLHGGQISVESNQGRGARFSVSLPVERNGFPQGTVFEESEDENPVPFLASERAEPAVSESSNGNGFSDPQDDRPSILVVEDNPDLRSFISETMGDGYQILTASNGRIGLELALEHIPSLIISDVMMPEMDGFALCSKLKSEERTCHIPLILLTAKAGQGHKLEGLATGADDYLTKPFDGRELQVRVSNLIEQRERLQRQFSRYIGIPKTGSIQLVSADERFLEKVYAAIQKELDNEFFSVEDLAEAVSFSRSQLHRKLKGLTGKSPTELIRECRLNQAKLLLEQGVGNVSEIAIQVGYSSVSYFTRSFKQVFGILPSEV
ncbi:MAG: ATP-binding protein [Saprospiraceae bacterium]